ncbi:hypothetical protein BCR34DRAFT_534828 [Clohesyomyces aquaticus]|uniref:FAD-binding domain-containing protein n=1 Tax=Clohesyomyces aquaticus TaxID=1231657 RepID=A0A1Y1ZV12_9PLEO|nr:hypothetical protein BCR34DRAFT_534828 [Clohesyomyces aquaticus]
MHVLISGAGIAGPTLAYFLSKAGATITILERSESLLPHGQNIDIKGSAVKVIETMGLIDQLRKLNTTEMGAQFIDSKGRPFAQFPVTGAASPTAEFEILRGDLAIILSDATKEDPNVTYLLGTTIQEVITNDNDTVKVKLSNGEVQEFDLLVAADGQWSKTRSQCFPSETVTVVDKGLYVAYFTVPRLSGDNAWWKIYHALGSRIISLRPDPHGTIRALLGRMPCNDSQKKAWLEASKSDRDAQETLLKSEFADAGWQAQRLLDAMGEAPDFYFQAVQQVKMSKWSNSRVVCLGDAAHAPTPLTGMGTSLAILGAYILAGELSKLGDGDPPFQALEAYENTFRPFVEKIQKIPSFIPGIAHPGTPLKRWLFQTVVLIVSKIIANPLVVWVGKKFGGSYGAHEFPLPHFSKLDVEGGH